MPTLIPLPDDPAALTWTGDPSALPAPLTEWFADTYAAVVTDTREPCSAVLAVGRMATEAARFRRWPRWYADVLGDLATQYCQRICDDTIGAID